MKFFFTKLSCERREDEIESIKEYICSSRDGSLVENIEDSDVIIFYTCGVATATIERGIKKIKEIQKDFPQKKLIVCGCMPAINLERLRTVFDGPTCTPTDFSALDEYLDYHLTREDIKKVKGCYEEDDKTRLNIIVEKGCIRRCSYCAIGDAVGKIMSKDSDEIIRVIEKGIKEDARCINLQGDSVGDYGYDIGMNLGELLKRIDNLDGEFTIEIEDLHPVIFLKHYETLKKLIDKKRIVELLIPIQSGSPRVLKAMNRPIDVELLTERILEIKKAGTNVNTDIIIGFPGETDEDFDMTYDLLKKVNFSYINVNVYGEHKSAPSYAMENKVSQKKMLRRSVRILQSNFNISREMLEFQMGFIMEKIKE